VKGDTAPWPTTVTSASNCVRWGQKWRWFFLALALILSGACTSKLAKEIQLVSEPRSFTLSEPIKTVKGVLPPGDYLCQYADTGGYFFEAPASLDEAFLFHGGVSGGIYVSRRMPRTFHLFFQDKHAETVYSPSFGMMTFGGSGLFKLTDELHDDALEKISIKGD
jgi:hypothetical protein